MLQVSFWSHFVELLKSDLDPQTNPLKVSTATAAVKGSLAELFLSMHQCTLVFIGHIHWQKISVKLPSIVGVAELI
jgi:hypothetical protein